MRSGTKHLRIASAIQILLGLGHLAFTYFLAGEWDGTGADAETALGILAHSYGGYIFQVIAGLLGLLLSNKKSLLTVILGALLFVPQLVTFLHVQNSIPLIILNAILLLIPYYYLHNAVKNFKA